jgi:hypothetical protein
MSPLAIQKIKNKSTPQKPINKGGFFFFFVPLLVGEWGRSCWGLQCSRKEAIFFSFLLFFAAAGGCAVFTIGQGDGRQLVEGDAMGRG